jgi:hypothetical protein
MGAYCQSVQFLCCQFRSAANESNTNIILNTSPALLKLFTLQSDSSVHDTDRTNTIKLSSGCSRSLHMCITSRYIVSMLNNLLIFDRIAFRASPQHKLIVCTICACVISGHRWLTYSAKSTNRR